MTTKKQAAADAETELMDAWTLFQVGLTKRGPYPLRELQLVLESAKTYSSVMAESLFIHKTVASNFSGFCDFLEIERKRVPGKALELASRIETIILSGYDPYFEGDEPPGL